MKKLFAVLLSTMMLLNTAPNAEAGLFGRCRVRNRCCQRVQRVQCVQVQSGTIQEIETVPPNNVQVPEIPDAPPPPPLDVPNTSLKINVGPETPAVQSSKPEDTRQIVSYTPRRFSLVGTFTPAVQSSEPEDTRQSDKPARPFSLLGISSPPPAPKSEPEPELKPDPEPEKPKPYEFNLIGASD